MKIRLNNLIQGVLILLLIQSCREDDIPVVTTSEMNSISRTSAWCSGTIINNGSDTLTDKGFCWNTEINPTLATFSETAEYENEGDLQTYINRLIPDTKYYVRAFATNRFGTNYGNQVSFTTRPAGGTILFNPGLTYGSLSDVEGNYYKTIKIGTQEWMAENLKTTHYNDGTLIPFITEPSIFVVYTPAYGWYEDNEAIYKNLYGAYYNWSAVNTGNLCPTGWHVPSDDEWKIMEMSLGATSEQADRKNGQVEFAAGIAEGGTDFWVKGCSMRSNITGFTGLPGGGKERAEGINGNWWTSTELDLINHGDLAWIRYILCGASTIFRSETTKSNFFNVRCIKNN
jgi:uncharacterized protein (TIGR02145 family)